MRLISAHAGQLITVDAASDGSLPRRADAVVSGWSALDDLLPPTGLARSAVHELLHRIDHPPPLFAAAVLARLAENGSRQKASGQEASALFWLDMTRTLYPPALFGLGVSPRRLWIIRPRDTEEAVWSLAECLRCRGVGAVVAAPLPTVSSGRRIDRRDVRRLQLAVERGGGVGVFIRPMDRDTDLYAAATRWLVEPAPGTRTAQRWKITLIHGHGGRVGQSVLLEHCRDIYAPNLVVRSPAELVDRSRVASVG